MSTKQEQIEVASTIAMQLGGTARLAVIAGCRHFLAGDNSLQFKVGRNHKKVTTVIVTLDGNDTYTVALYRGAKKTSEQDGIYCDQLRRVIEEGTGLYLSL